MIYRPFGRSGIKVIPYCLGAMMFGSLANSAVLTGTSMDSLRRKKRQSGSQKIEYRR